VTEGEGRGRARARGALERWLFGPEGFDLSSLPQLRPLRIPWWRVLAAYAAHIALAVVISVVREFGGRQSRLSLLVFIQPLLLLSSLVLVRLPPANFVGWYDKIGRWLRSLGFSLALPRRFTWARLLALGAVWGTALRLLVVLVALAQALVGVQVEASNNPLQAASGLDFVDYVLVLFAGVFLAPLAEELFFRGVLYRSLLGRLNFASSLVISSLVWALLHLIPGVTAPFFLVGVVLVLLYEMTGTLWMPIAAHAFFNLSSFVILFLYKALS